MAQGAGFAGLEWGLPALGLAALIVASAMRDLRMLRLGIAAAALIWLVAAVRAHAVLPAVGATLLLLVNLLQAWLLAAGDRRVRFSAEEEAMASGVLARMPRRQARQLLDQGMWISGKPGEVLTREGESVSHLFYLAQGSANVTNGGRHVATCRPRHFIGEITVLTDQPATGTVSLDGPARFWCVAADALRRFLAANPELRGPLEDSFSGNLREKLVLANREIAAAGGVASGP